MNDTLFEGLFGRVYSFYMQRPWLSRPIGLLVWGGDTRAFYESMGAVSDLPDGAVVVDAPCGAGVAFGALPRTLDVRYIALDRSPGMLARARSRGGELGLTQVEFIEGDAERIPVEDRSVDLFLSYWGLHCFADPEQDVREIALCLRPRGRAIGSMICRGRHLRQRLLVRPGLSGFGPGGTTDDLERWIAAAGLELTTMHVSGPFACFEASA